MNNSCMNIENAVAGGVFIIASPPLHISLEVAGSNSSAVRRLRKPKGEDVPFFDCPRRSKAKGWDL